MILIFHALQLLTTAYDWMVVIKRKPSVLQRIHLTKFKLVQKFQLIPRPQSQSTAIFYEPLQHFALAVGLLVSKREKTDIVGRQYGQMRHRRDEMTREMTRPLSDASKNISILIITSHLVFFPLFSYFRKRCPMVLYSKNPCNKINILKV